jgi:cell division protein FtsI (penicillin-binding protein 3)
MSAALNRLGVVRDAPEEVEELVAHKDSKKHAKRADEDADSDTVADLTTPFTAEEMNAASGDSYQPEEVLAVTDPSAPKAPNFVGKTVRDVMQEATATGIQVDLFGDGLARAQNPAAGTLLNPGEHIRVRFQQ